MSHSLNSIANILKAGKSNQFISGHLLHAILGNIDHLYRYPKHFHLDATKKTGNAQLALLINQYIIFILLTSLNYPSESSILFHVTRHTILDMLCFPDVTLRYNNSKDTWLIRVPVSSTLMVKEIEKYYKVTNTTQKTPDNKLLMAIDLMLRDLCCLSSSLPLFVLFSLKCKEIKPLWLALTETLTEKECAALCTPYMALYFKKLAKQLRTLLCSYRSTELENFLSWCTSISSLLKSKLFHPASANSHTKGNPVATILNLNEADFIKFILINYNIYTINCNCSEWHISSKSRLSEKFINTLCHPGQNKELYIILLILCYYIYSQTSGFSVYEMCITHFPECVSTVQALGLVAAHISGDIPDIYNHLGTKVQLLNCAYSYCLLPNTGDTTQHRCVQIWTGQPHQAPTYPAYVRISNY